MKSKKKIQSLIFKQTIKLRSSNTIAIIKKCKIKRFNNEVKIACEFLFVTHVTAILFHFIELRFFPKSLSKIVLVCCLFLSLLARLLRK